MVGAPGQGHHQSINLSGNAMVEDLLKAQIQITRFKAIESSEDKRKLLIDFHQTTLGSQRLFQQLIEEPTEDEISYKLKLAKYAAYVGELPDVKLDEAFEEVAMEGFEFLKQSKQRFLNKWGGEDHPIIDY